MPEVQANSATAAFPSDDGKPSAGGSGSGPANRKAKGRVLFYIAIALAVVAGGVYFVVHSKPPTVASTTSETESTLALDTFVVNLDGAGQRAYLRVGISLGLSGTHKKDDIPVAPLRDAVLSVLSNAQPEQLLAAEGKEKLKADLLRALQERAPDLGINSVYFTEFLVQM